MQPLITELPEKFGTGKSRSPTSKILLRSVDKKLCNWELCVINAYRPKYP